MRRKYGYTLWGMISYDNWSRRQYNARQCNTMPGKAMQSNTTPISGRPTTGSGMDHLTFLAFPTHQLNIATSCFEILLGSVSQLLLQAWQGSCAVCPMMQERSTSTKEYPAGWYYVSLPWYCGESGTSAAASFQSLRHLATAKARTHKETLLLLLLHSSTPQRNIKDKKMRAVMIALLPLAAVKVRLKN